MERLTYRTDGKLYYRGPMETSDGDIVDEALLDPDHGGLGRYQDKILLERLAQYEDLEEQGLLVKLPNKL